MIKRIVLSVVIGLPIVAAIIVIVQKYRLAKYLPDLSSDEASFVWTKTFSSRNYGKIITCSKKKVLSEKSTKQKKPIIFPFKFSTNKILLQSAVGVFALGFIDAGYSGDWSRIGVISKETEELLKLTAFVVVPSCLFLIFSFFEKVEK